MSKKVAAGSGAEKKEEAVCATCKSTIAGPVLTAIGKSYHPDHFVCMKCKQPIKEKFLQHENEPYCEKDYNALFLKRCHSCKEPIKEKVISALGVEWHEEHFTCATCKSPLAGKQFMEHDGSPYCERDFYEAFAPKCHLCQKPIKEQVVSALDKEWHPDCFKCSKCDQPIKDGRYALEDAKPVCVKCAS